ncbi:Ig-like domain-containing protein [Microbacterium elymi]
MRPGRSVAVPVLTNDSDPEGDRVGLVADGLILPDVPGLSAEVLGDRVVVTAPDEPVETSLQYTIQDTNGATAVGVLQISVRTDVPLRPVARDDRVQARGHQGRFGHAQRPRQRRGPRRHDRGAGRVGGG